MHILIRIVMFVRFQPIEMRKQFLPGSMTRPGMKTADCKRTESIQNPLEMYLLKNLMSLRYRTDVHSNVSTKPCTRLEKSSCIACSSYRKFC